MLKRFREVDFKEETKQSYLGLLKHGNTFKIKNKFLI
jgi:hypothetical protein